MRRTVFVFAIALLLVGACDNNSLVEDLQDQFPYETAETIRSPSEIGPGSSFCSSGPVEQDPGNDMASCMSNCLSQDSCGECCDSVSCDPCAGQPCLDDDCTTCEAPDVLLEDCSQCHKNCRIKLALCVAMCHLQYPAP